MNGAERETKSTQKHGSDSGGRNRPAAASSRNNMKRSYRNSGVDLLGLLTELYIGSVEIKANFLNMQLLHFSDETNENHQYIQDAKARMEGRGEVFENVKLRRMY